MSSRYVLTPVAQADLNAIEDQTFDSFGLGPALSLSQAMHRVFADLAEQPGLGHLREDLSPPHRPFRYITIKQRFMVIYLPIDDGSPSSA
ncbi:MAG: type II toxin-antitoxin system RelE/ParE family toxin [Planctomycetes bacterium]|nr:type II toxin-antitoxin system RelE/ParE family toxin [Planctomycetota bacterium]